MHGFVDIVQNDAEVPPGVFAELFAEWQVPFRLLRPDLGEELPRSRNALIVLGGAMGVHDEAAYPFLRTVKERMRRALDDAVPLFGICLGGQLLAEVAGGSVAGNRCGETGLVEIRLTPAGVADPLFSGFAEGFRVFQWHNDSFELPPAATHLASSTVCPGQAFRIGNAWGVQFHPEVDLAIVAAWSRNSARQQSLTGEFTPVEAEHRQLGRLLLGNFLDAAGVSR